MLAQRMPSILPDLSFDEALEVTKIHSIAGLLPKDQPLILNRPFRSPHHTISSAGLSGGGSTPKPGELSLAHNGILFLDELPEFRRDSLEVLRQPLEDGNVTISRVNATLTYPCNIMLIASMNLANAVISVTVADNVPVLRHRLIVIAVEYRVRCLTELTFKLKYRMLIMKI